MSRHLERLLQIDSLLRSQQKQTSERRRESLDVTERTIRSDLAFLRDRYHAPLEFNRKQGSTVVDSKSKPEKPIFSFVI